MIDAAETPKEAARRLARVVIAQGFKPEALHEYVNADGQISYWRIRAKHADGRKWIRPMMLNGHGYELREPDFPDGAKPLYNLDKIAADDQTTIWIVEGEKAADALVKLGVVATTSGSATSASAADWTPLRGRVCTLWPDNDEAGRRYVDSVANALAALDCTLYVVNVARLELPSAGDAFEWLQAHQNATQDNLAALPVLPYHATPQSAPDTELASVELLRADAVRMKPVRWLWRDYLAAGKLHILAGEPGTGKTTLALALAATLTIAGRWPDGTHAETGDVLIWSGEDDIDDTLTPRLAAAGADLRRVHFARRTRAPDGSSQRFDPSNDFPLLSVEAARLPALRLVLLDPVVTVVGTGMDSHKNAEVRRALQPLAEFAERHDCAVLGISHFTKGTAGRNPVERVTGSLAFGAAARVVLATAQLRKEEGSGCVVVRAKSNIGPDGGGFRFDLDRVDVRPGISGQRVLWRDAIEGSAREILGAAEATVDPEERGALADAEAFLREELAAGPVPSSEVQRDAERAGHAWPTVRRAQKKLEITPRKAGFAVGWVWEIPPKMLNDAEDAQNNVVSTFGKDELLREPAEATNAALALTADAYRQAREG